MVLLLKEFAPRDALILSAQIYEVFMDLYCPLALNYVALQHGAIFKYQGQL